MGSGTTSLAARNLGRNSIGYEINPEFIDIVKEKLNVNQVDIAGTTYEFLKDKIDIDPEKSLKTHLIVLSIFKIWIKELTPKTSIRFKNR